MKFFRLNKKLPPSGAEIAAKKKAAQVVARRIKPDPRSPLAKNTILEGYQFDKVIGRGSFSLVYFAVETRSKTPVVIKEYYPKHFSIRRDDGNIIPKDGQRLVTFSEGFKQFFNEAMALNKITHPNVLKASNVFRANKTAYLVSSNTGGRDLKWFLSSTKQRLNAPLFYSVFMPMLSAIQFLHTAELLHLDVKPANILLQPNSEPLLLDFGAAQSFSSKKRINTLQTLTHGFAPPEQYDRKRSLGPWTDIYAMAATMYYSIACKAPVKAKDAKAENQLNVAAFSKSYSISLLKTINRALSFDPGNRFETVDSFAAELLKESKWATLRDYEKQVLAYDRYEKTALESQQALIKTVA